MSIITDFSQVSQSSAELVHTFKLQPGNLDEKLAAQKDHIPTWLNLNLSTDLNHKVNHLYKILTNSKYTPSTRCEVFLTEFNKSSHEIRHVVLYLLISDPITREIFISFSLMTEFPDLSLQKALFEVFLGRHNKTILQTLYGSEESLHLNELKRHSIMALGDIFGFIAQTWNMLSAGEITPISSIEELEKMSIFWVQSLFDIDSSTNVHAAHFVDYLIEKYHKTIINLALYPKDRLLEDRNYFLFHQPILQLLIHSRKGVKLFREILNTYGSSKCWDNKFLNKILFADKKMPCDKDAKTEHLKSIFTKEYSLSDECRQFVIRSGTCFVPMIARIVNQPPPLKMRHSWQSYLEDLLQRGGNKDLYESAVDHFSWAFHFAEIPADAYGILSHYIDFTKLVTNYLNSDLAKNFSDFRTLFDFVMSDPKLYQLLRIKRPEFTKRVLKDRFFNLFQSYLIEPLSQKQIRLMRITHPTINPSSIQKLENRKTQAFIYSIVRQKDSNFLSDAIANLIEVAQNYSIDDKHKVYTKFINDTLKRTNMIVLKLFGIMPVDDLARLIGYMWSENILTTSLFSKIFHGPTRSLSFPPYKQFMDAVDSLTISNEIHQGLELSSQQSFDSTYLCFVATNVNGRNHDCSIQ